MRRKVFNVYCPYKRQSLSIPLPSLIIYFFVNRDFFAGINKENIQLSALFFQFLLQHRFLQTPAFPDQSFYPISVNCSFKKFTADPNSESDSYRM